MKARLVIDYRFVAAGNNIGTVIDILVKQINADPLITFDTWTLTVDHEGVSETVTSDNWREVCQ